MPNYEAHPWAEHAARLSNCCRNSLLGLAFPVTARVERRLVIDAVATSERGGEREASIPTRNGEPPKGACHSNALDRPNSRPKLRCTVTPAVARFPRSVADREGLIEICQRRHQDVLTWGWRREKERFGMSAARRKWRRVNSPLTLRPYLKRDFWCAHAGTRTGSREIRW